MEDRGKKRDDQTEEKDRDQRGDHDVNVGDDQADEGESRPILPCPSDLCAGHVTGDDRGEDQRDAEYACDVAERSDQGGHQANHGERVDATSGDLRRIRGVAAYRDHCGRAGLLADHLRLWGLAWKVGGGCCHGNQSRHSYLQSIEWRFPKKRR
jgi:hypothetical protein